MTSIFLKKPLPEEKQELLRVMARVSHVLGLRYFIVGATARDILMHYFHGFQINRASPDIDFALAIPDWDAFGALKAALLREQGFREDAQIFHRLHYLPSAGDGFPIDLLPFGGVEMSRTKVAWPPDMKIIMNVAGYAEAMDCAVSVSIADDLVIPVASIPGLVMMKLIAWLDRGRSNAKDATDFRYLLENYADAGNTDRLYGEEFPLLAACGYTIERAGPRLLGLDVASIASEECKSQINTILATAADRDRLVTHMLKGSVQTDEQISRLQKSLDEFETGLMHWPKP